MKLRLTILSVVFLSILLFFSTNSAYATHDDVVVAAVETTGAARGPALQIYNKQTGALRLTVFVLNQNFGADFQIVQNVRNGGSQHERILVCGRETAGAARGPAFQLFERDGTLVHTRFVLNANFTELGCGTRDTDGDGIHEIITVGNETSGLARGWFLQIWNQTTGNVIGTVQTFNPDFKNSTLSVCSGRDDSCD